MEVKQLYTNCLAQGAYFIESNGEVAIIDPLREVDQYIEMAEAKGAAIKYIFETHFHADFVSGHITLAKKTGATIVYGPGAQADFDFHEATDGEEFTLGKLKIKVLHTPGHTLESTCFLLLNETEVAHAIFTGDTLFLGDVGRPDLAQKKGKLTSEDLAGMLYESLHSKIMPLDDSVIVYPGHGAGSACGKNMMKETMDSLGNQKLVNYALDTNLTKLAFVNTVLDGLAPPPEYFPINVLLNKSGYEDIDQILRNGLTALGVEDVKRMQEEGVMILDVRSKEAFAEAHLAGSIFIGLDGSFAPWVGAVIKDVHQQIILVTPEGREKETVIRLARVGFDACKGYVEGGVAAWAKAGNKLSKTKTISAEAFKEINDEVSVFDVRKEGEHDSGHVDHSVLTPLSQLENHLDLYASKSKKYVYCRSGYRSLVAISILKRAGVENLINIDGGYNSIDKVSPCLLINSI